MVKKLRVLALSLLGFIFIVWNKDMVPIKREITDLQLIQSVGMDLGQNNKYKISVLSNQKALSAASQSSGGSGSSSSSGGTNSQKIATVEATTFNSRIKTLGIYFSKICSIITCKICIFRRKYS